MTEPNMSGSLAQGATGRELMRSPQIPGGVPQRRLTTRRQALSKNLREVKDTGLATAEYAIAMIAAAGFAGLLITVLRSSAVRTMLTSIVKSALSIP